MKREARDNRANAPKPVERMALDEKHSKKRIILLAASLIIAAAAFLYALFSALHVEAGWREITDDGTQGLTCAGDFVFQYRLGSGEKSAALEVKELTKWYTEAAARAFRLFDGVKEYADCNNVATLNRRINEPVQMDSGLYAALKTANQGRYLYLGFLYQDDYALFRSASDAEAAPFDPLHSQEEAAFRQEAARWARDESAVWLEFLENDAVCLHVSEEYAAFAREYESTAFIDFGWMKNAFIADFLAQELQDMGYRCGYLSSYDGFVRNLDAGNQFGYDVFDVKEEKLYQAAALQYQAPSSLLCLRSFRASEKETYFYRWQDGSVRTAHLSPEDGAHRDAFTSLTALSKEKGCGDMLMRLLPVQISDASDAQALAALEREGILTLALQNGQRVYGSESLEMRE